MSNQKSKESRFLTTPFSIKRGQIRLDLPYLGKFKWGLNFPIEVHVFFVAVPDYTTYGEFSPSGKFWHDEMQKRNRTVSKELQLFVSMIKRRKDARLAKAKFNDMNRIAKNYKHWNRVDLEDMKYQFISYDLNHDGLIDFPELEKVLDELGDTTSHELRRKIFDEIDVDGSDSVDFEEF
ncbi:uncharacterized protein [Amphiura filiformis]|uniref:uncharacterized protein n=1 Tax=Amphiura filiformis TaxID=82378 RepID=UPI003B21453C